MIRKFSYPFNLGILKKIYYPGSGTDLETLRLILSEFNFVEDIIFSDYIMHLAKHNLQELEDWEVIKEIPLTPGFFKKDNWGEFWYQDNRSTSFAQPNQIESTLYVLFHLKTHRIVRFFQLATEGVGTYKVLSRVGLRPNLIFLADHGFGANWNPNIWGEPTNNSDKISFLKNIAIKNRFIMVDKKSTDPWSEYQLDPNFQHERWCLYKRNEINKLRIDENLEHDKNPPKSKKRPHRPGINPNPGINESPKSSLLFFDPGVE